MGRSLWYRLRPYQLALSNGDIVYCIFDDPDSAVGYLAEDDRQKQFAQNARHETRTGHDQQTVRGGQEHFDDEKARVV